MPVVVALIVALAALFMLGVLTGWIWPSLICSILVAFAFSFGSTLAYYVGWKHLSNGDDVGRGGRIILLTIYISFFGLPISMVLGAAGRVVSFSLARRHGGAAAPN